ncbi:hypothetical protein Tco_0887767 [Tanacetum coccineum]
MPTFVPCLPPHVMGLMWLSLWSLFELLANVLLIQFMASFWENVWLIPFQDGMNAMLENGPCFIRNIPLILKKWTSDANLLNEDVCNVLILVKFHDVPNTAFSEHGFSPIATKFATHLMLDSYISMIKLRVDVELKDTIVVAIPKEVVYAHCTC